MKVVINTCFGGFSLSAKAVRRLAELKGKECHFFKHDYEGKRKLDFDPIPISEKAADKGLTFFAFDVPNPQDFLSGKRWQDKSAKERDADHKFWQAHQLESRPGDRTDPDLVKVVEELGKAANGRCADLSIVEIPDDAEWEIAENDGNEHIAERHRTWQ